MCVRASTCVRAITCVRVYLCTRAHVHMCRYVCVYAYVCMCVCVLVSAYLLTQMRARTSFCVCTRMHIVFLSMSSCAHYVVDLITSCGVLCYTHLRTYVRVYKDACVKVLLCTSIHTCVPMRGRVRTHARSHTRIHMYTRTYACMYASVCKPE